MTIKIINVQKDTWYENCLDKTFVVQSESRKDGKGKYVVRLNKKDRYLMNGYVYGWVDKEDCKIINH